MRIEEITKIRITQEMMDQAKSDSLHLQRENTGQKTRYGSNDRDIKGSLGQQAVGIYLSRANVPHVYSDPYSPKQYGDYGDIKIFGETYDVKCRGTWQNNIYFQSFLIGEHEKNNKTDHYIFTTIDSSNDYIYILGAISKHDLFNSLTRIPDSVKLKFPAAGKMMAKDLKPLMKYIMRV